jgi:hypothetical protein
VSLEARAKVAHADDGVDNGEENEEDGDDGKGGQRSANGEVSVLISRLVYSANLEDEVRKSSEIEDDDANHAGLVLPPGEVCGGQQDGNGDRNGGASQGELRIVLPSDNDDKLHNVAKEEEEVKLKQRNVNLSKVRRAEIKVL